MANKTCFGPPKTKEIQNPEHYVLQRTFGSDNCDASQATEIDFQDLGVADGKCTSSFLNDFCMISTNADGTVNVKLGCSTNLCDDPDCIEVTNWVSGTCRSQLGVDDYGDFVLTPFKSLKTCDIKASSSSNALSGGAIAGATIGALLGAALLVVGVVKCRGRSKGYIEI